jgi:hypothetical protein
MKNRLSHASVEIIFDLLQPGSRENIQNVFRADIYRAVIMASSLIAVVVFGFINTDALAKGFEDGLQSAHWPLSSAPTQTGQIRRESGIALGALSTSKSGALAHPLAHVRARDFRVPNRERPQVQGRDHFPFNDSIWAPIGGASLRGDVL